MSFSSLEAMVGASLDPMFPGETSDLEEATIGGDARGRRSPRWRRYGDLLDRMMAMPASSPPWGHHLWRHSSAGRTCERLGGWASVSTCFTRGDQGGAACHLPSTTTSLGGMVQRGLGDGRGMMDARRTVAPSGVMVASTAGLLAASFMFFEKKNLLQYLRTSIFF